MCFSFSVIFSILNIRQVLQCVFIFFSCFSELPWHISLPTLCVYHFPWFQFSQLILGPTLYISHFPGLWVFLAVFHVLQCVFLIFHDFQFSHHIPGPRVCISNFPRFWVFLAINSSPTVCISQFLLFQCSLPYFTSYSVHFSFFVFSVS